MNRLEYFTRVTFDIGAVIVLGIVALLLDAIDWVRKERAWH